MKRILFRLLICLIIIVPTFSHNNVSAVGKSGFVNVDEKQNEVSIFKSEKVEGGVWEYGTKTNRPLFKPNTKEVWSNYWHPDYYHSSAAQLGANTPTRSGCRPKDETASARQVSQNTDLTGFAYYDTHCDPWS